MSVPPTDQPAKLECDLVMKGGLTSGVIYPQLVAELAGKYRFRSIGGTSAGAIAAAATAAAQLGVLRNPQSDAFQKLKDLPSQLGSIGADGHSKLLNLFQPASAFKGHFSLLLSALNAPSGWTRIRRLALKAVQEFPLGALIGALTGLLILFSSWGLGWLLALVLTAVGAVLGAGVQAAASLFKALPANGFGICSGLTTGSGEALTPWLEGYLRTLAGVKDDTPVTFGDLWSATPHPDGKLPLDLVMMTTAVNVGRPYRVPFESNDLYFLEDELKAFFPPNVMKWLVDNARQGSEVAQQLQRADGKRYLPLPRPENLPIIFGVRLSLSFPILLSAIPLYTVDRTLAKNQPEATEAARVLFSDGGVASNFPVHFFDSPLPGRPTFAVNLRDHVDGQQLVYLPPPLKNDRGVAVRVRKLKTETGFGAVASFLSLLLDAARSWRDEIQLSQPAFRDRIVHIGQKDGEGGLNLNMPQPLIETLGTRGADAAKVLVDAFHPNGVSQGVAWDNHQRIRLRVTAAQLQVFVQQLDRALKRSDPDYSSVAGNPPVVGSYPWSNAEAAAAKAFLGEVQAALNKLDASGIDLTQGAPRPSPELRISPRI